MSATLIYLAGKHAEYSSTLDWISQQLSACSFFQTTHPDIATQLSARLHQARRRLTTLGRVVLLGSRGLVPRGLSVVNELQFDILVLSDNYVAAIRNEGTHERQFGKVAMDAARRCGFVLPSDFLVSLSGGHAVLTALPTAPLLFAPPHQRFTLIDLAGMYHEFGHIAFALTSDIADRLTSIVDIYFRGLEQAAGPLTPAARAERLREIHRAARYWNLDRLSELFCDIFATYTLGPAHYYSCVDLAMRHGDRPDEIDFADVHPPSGSRVTACRLTLPEPQRTDLVSLSTSTLWQEYCASTTTSNEYRLLSPDALLAEIVTASTHSITMAGYRLYRPWTQAPSLNLGPDMNLEAVLNEAALSLIQSPGSYQAWEQRVIPYIFE